MDRTTTQQLHKQIVYTNLAFDMASDIAERELVSPATLGHFYRICKLAGLDHEIVLTTAYEMNDK